MEMIAESAASAAACESSEKKKKKCATTYSETYTEEFPFILRSRRGNSYVFCNVCCVDFKISHKGKGDIMKHIATDKHQTAFHASKKCKKLNEQYFQTSDDFSVIRAEALFTAYLVEHNIPLSAADHVALLFKKMFPDSNIVKKYGCARTKTAAIVREMASTERNTIIANMKKVPFAVATDGSNKGDKKLYPIVVNYFSDEKKHIETSLLSVPVLEGDSTGENISKLILDTLKSFEIPLENCLSFFSDNAPVMIGKKSGAAGFLLKDIPHLFVSGCLCHLINLAAEKGAACMPINIEEYVIDIYYYLEKSVKRKEKLKKFQQLYDLEVRKILKHVSTRWLSLDRCLKRLIEQWNPLTSFFREETQNGLDACSRSKLKDYSIPRLSHSKVSTVTKSAACVDSSPSSSSKKTFTCLTQSKKEINKPQSSKLDVFKFHKHNQGSKASNVLRRKEISIATSAPASQNKLDDVSKYLSSQLKKPDISVGEKRKSAISVPPKNKKAKVSPKSVSSSKKSSNAPNILSRQERLFLFLSSNINKAFVNFLSNVMPIFSEYNIAFQSKEPKIHISRSMLLDMFKCILSRFVLPGVMKNSPSLLDIDYHNHSNQKLNTDIMIGQAAFNIISEVSAKKQAEFYDVVRNYYITVCDYMRHKFPFSDEVLINAEVADLDKIDKMSFDSVKYFIKRFPAMVKVMDSDCSEEDVLDKLQSEFCSLQIEDISNIIKSEDRMDTKWFKLSEFYRGKYTLFLKFVTSVLTFPHSNAECERIFSYVSKTQTQFRSQFSAQTLENLLTVKSNMTKTCYEQDFDRNFLKRAKSATTIHNQGSHCS